MALMFYSERALLLSQGLSLLLLIVLVLMFLLDCLAKKKKGTIFYLYNSTYTNDY